MLNWPWGLLDLAPRAAPGIKADEVEGSRKLYMHVAAAGKVLGAGGLGGGVRQSPTPSISANPCLSRNWQKHVRVA